MTQYFGTDGIRTTDMAALARLGYRLGLAQAGKGKVVVAEDNRPTSARIAMAVMAGLGAASVDVVYGGVMPTPALQYAIKQLTADGGIMVTASHNAAQYNGLKYFDADGNKPDCAEAETMLCSANDLPEGADVPTLALPVALHVTDAYRHKFRAFGTLPLAVAVDCANGAAYPIVKRIMHQHGIEGTYLHHGEGKQINRDCGALHPSVSEMQGADMGFALDGDGDRCVVVTKGGRVVDGDGILYLLARYRRQKGMHVGEDVEGGFHAEISGKDSASAIGYRGEVLDAIQYLATIHINKSDSSYTRLTIDVEGYRARRADTLKALALRLADKAVREGRQVELEPMNNTDRRIIHETLAGDERVTTESFGDEPNRYVIIVPKEREVTYGTNKSFRTGGIKTRSFGGKKRRF